MLQIYVLLPCWFEYKELSSEKLSEKFWSAHEKNGPGELSGGPMFHGKTVRSGRNDPGGPLFHGRTILKKTTIFVEGIEN